MIDLLNVSTQDSNHYKGANTELEELFLFEVKSAEDVANLYNRGTHNKQLFDSKSNRNSGKSHLVLSIQIEHKSIGE